MWIVVEEWLNLRDCVAIFDVFRVIREFVESIVGEVRDRDCLVIVVTGERDGRDW